MGTSVNVTNAVKAKIYIPPVQSADTLFQFVDKIDYLIEILERDAIVPRYCVEKVDYLNIKYNEIAYPMLCFCDINLHKIKEHINFYGGYGVAFSKQWGIGIGIQPVQYINTNSALKKTFTNAFNMAMNYSYSDEAQNYLLSQMYFLKPIEGDMPRNDKIEFRNFTDECEWRYIPNVEIEEMPGVLTESGLLQRDMLNKALKYANRTWLKYSISDIKYLIIQNKEDFDLIINVILKKKNLSDQQRNILISKIIIWDESKGDF